MKKIDQAILYISNHFRDKLTLDILALEVGLSKFHFQRVFKKVSGKTPQQYIKQVRLEHAAHFINLFPKAKMIEVAFESGFSSPSVFSREFLKFYQKTPIELQKTVTIVEPTVDLNTKLPITFINKITIQANLSNLETENVNALYSKINRETKMYGVFYDVPMHKPLKDCRYCAGPQVEKKSNDTITIEEGYYTYIDVTGSFESFIELIFEFKENQIDTSPYEIDSLHAFEKVLIPKELDYFSSKRRVYIKIKRK